jgi:hypothetical protein
MRDWDGNSRGLLIAAILPAAPVSRKFFNLI